jgi:hypothetical protein
VIIAFPSAFDRPSLQISLASVSEQSNRCRDRRNSMHFTIDAEHNIQGFPQGMLVDSTNPHAFSSAAGLSALPVDLAEVWNSFAGAPGFTDCRQVTKFTSRKIGAERIWTAIQRLAAEPEQEAPNPATEVAAAAVQEPQATTNADTAPQAARVAPSKGKAGRKANRGKNAPNAPNAPKTKKAPKPKKPAKAQDAAGPREGTKTAEVLAMLQRKGGATLQEIMDKMGWQKHTVRGFMAGAMKKAGYTVDSFKPEGGERTYRINQ